MPPWPALTRPSTPSFVSPIRARIPIRAPPPRFRLLHVGELRGSAHMQPALPRSGAALGGAGAAKIALHPTENRRASVVALFSRRVSCVTHLARSSELFAPA